MSNNNTKYKKKLLIEKYSRRTMFEEYLFDLFDKSEQIVHIHAIDYVIIYDDVESVYYPYMTIFTISFNFNPSIDGNNYKDINHCEFRASGFVYDFLVSMCVNMDEDEQGSFFGELHTIIGKILKYDIEGRKLIIC